MKKRAFRRALWNALATLGLAPTKPGNGSLRVCRKLLWKLPPDARVRCFGYTVRITDGPNFYMQYKDEFLRRIYHFDCARPDPLIIDGGSNMGLSILYFKRVYPAAQVIGFEPDPAIYRLLDENIKTNKLDRVKIVNAALGATSGKMGFKPDHTAGGQLSALGDMHVPVERLSAYLKDPVDFLKLNIEGEELHVLREAADSGLLKHVSQLVIEYHGWPSGPQNLGIILELLEHEGFGYLVHDFDHETCATTKPPFHWTAQMTWFCLIYARPRDS